MVLTLDATWDTATVLTCPEAIQVGQAILKAAQVPQDKLQQIAQILHD